MVRRAPAGRRRQRRPGPTRPWLLGGAPWNAPQGYGYSLGVVYLMWIVVLVLLYPPCRWFAALKRRRRDAWLSYF